jgi:hypothetical protein
MSSSRNGFRICTKSGCNERAIATLSYNYGEQVASITPLISAQEPHTYDLCLSHSEKLTVPQGWQIELAQLQREPEPSQEDLRAIADAVRNVAAQSIKEPAPESKDKSDLRRRGHLRAL